MGVDVESVSDFVEDVVGGHVDVARVVYGGAVVRDHVADTDREVSAAPAAVVMSRFDGEHVELAGLYVITGLGFRDAGKAELGNDVGRASGDHEVRTLVELRQRPAVEVIDVGVGDENRVVVGDRCAPAPTEWIDQNSLAVDIDDGGGVAQPGDAGSTNDTHKVPIAREWGRWC